MLKNWKVTPAMNIVLHSGLGLLVGILASVLTAVGQIVLNTGSNIHVIYATGIAAFSVSLGHSFVALRTNPALPQAINDFASELKISPALVPDIEAFAKQIAPFLAGELMKIRTPPVSALQPQQRPVQNQQVSQQPVQNSPFQPLVSNPGIQSGGGAPIGWNPQGTAVQNQQVYYDLATQQNQAIPPFSSGRGG